MSGFKIVAVIVGITLLATLLILVGYFAGDLLRDIWEWWKR